MDATNCNAPPSNADEIDEPTKPVVVDLTNICRICYATHEDLIPMFHQDARNNYLVDKINTYLPIMVTPRDGRPLGVCRACYNTVLNWHMVVERSVLTEKRLAQWLHVPIKIRHDCSYFLPAKTTENPPNPADSANVTHVFHPPSRWTPRCVSSETSTLDRDALKTENLTETTVEIGNSTEFDVSEGVVSDDDEPLASVAMKKPVNLYKNFITALQNFRDHYMKEHGDERSCATDSSDTSGSDEVDDERVDKFDDLTHNNMRKDRMDEQARLELNRVQTKINGKVYFTCPECGKNLSSPHTYIFHKRIHTGERPCVCHVCGKQFRAPNGLQRHLTETHERQRRYICVVCPKSFANSQNLKQHMRIHTGERPFVCSHCGKRFTQSGSLHAHLKTHSEQFAYQCAECGAKFRLRSGLSRHRLKHTGERPHVCVHCGKGFRQKHDLNGHMLTHTDTKPHSCNICGTAFRQRRALRHHCKRLHDNDRRDLVQTLYDHVGHYQ